MSYLVNLGYKYGKKRIFMFEIGENFLGVLNYSSHMFYHSLMFVTCSHYWCSLGFAIELILLGSKTWYVNLILSIEQKFSRKVCTVLSISSAYTQKVWVLNKFSFIYCWHHQRLHLDLEWRRTKSFFKLAVSNTFFCHKFDSNLIINDSCLRCYIWFLFKPSCFVVDVLDFFTQEQSGTRWNNKNV